MRGREGKVNEREMTLPWGGNSVGWNRKERERGRERENRDIVVICSTNSIIIFTFIAASFSNT